MTGSSSSKTEEAADLLQNVLWFLLADSNIRSTFGTKLKIKLFTSSTSGMIRNGVKYYQTCVNYQMESKKCIGGVVSAIATQDGLTTLEVYADDQTTIVPIDADSIPIIDHVHAYILMDELIRKMLGKKITIMELSNSASYNGKDGGPIFATYQVEGSKRAGLANIIVAANGTVDELKINFGGDDGVVVEIDNVDDNTDISLVMDVQLPPRAKVPRKVPETTTTATTTTTTTTPTTPIIPTLNLQKASTKKDNETTSSSRGGRCVPRFTPDPVSLIVKDPSTSHRSSRISKLLEKDQIASPSVVKDPSTSSRSTFRSIKFTPDLSSPIRDFSNIGGGSSRSSRVSKVTPIVAPIRRDPSIDIDSSRSSRLKFTPEPPITEPKYNDTNASHRRLSKLRFTPDPIQPVGITSRPSSAKSSSFSVGQTPKEPTRLSSKASSFTVGSSTFNKKDIDDDDDDDDEVDINNKSPKHMLLDVASPSKKLVSLNQQLELGPFPMSSCGKDSPVAAAVNTVTKPTSPPPATTSIAPPTLPKQKTKVASYDSADEEEEDDDSNNDSDEEDDKDDDDDDDDDEDDDDDSDNQSNTSSIDETPCPPRPRSAKAASFSAASAIPATTASPKKNRASFSVGDAKKRVSFSANLELGPFPGSSINAGKAAPLKPALVSGCTADQAINTPTPPPTTKTVKAASTTTSRYGSQNKPTFNYSYNKPNNTKESAKPTEVPTTAVVAPIVAALKSPRRSSTGENSNTSATSSEGVGPKSPSAPSTPSTPTKMSIRSRLANLNNIMFSPKSPKSPAAASTNNNNNDDAVTTTPKKKLAGIGRSNKLSLLISEFNKNSSSNNSSVAPPPPRWGGRKATSTAVSAALNPTSPGRGKFGSINNKNVPTATIVLSPKALVSGKDKMTAKGNGSSSSSSNKTTSPATGFFKAVRRSSFVPASA